MMHLAFPVGKYDAPVLRKQIGALELSDIGSSQRHKKTENFRIDRGTGPGGQSNGIREGSTVS